MIYEWFTNFVMGDSEQAVELLASSPTLQKSLAAGGMVVAIVAIILILYALIVLFRGWK